MENGVSSSQVCANNTSWIKWLKFTAWIGVNYDLTNVQYLVPILQIFSWRIRSGSLVVIGFRIQNHLVDQSLRLTSNLFATVGAVDPHMNHLWSV